MANVIQAPVRFHRGVGKTVREFDERFGRYSDRWRPPREITDEIKPIYVSFYKGDYDIPVIYDGQPAVVKDHTYNYFRHWLNDQNTFRSCSAPVVYKRDPQGNPEYSVAEQGCLLCDEQRGGAQGIKKATFNQALNLIVWGNQHLVEVKDGNSTKTFWEECAGYGCQRCAAGMTVHPFRRAYWPAGEWDLKEIASADRELVTRCAGCFNVGTLAVSGSKCPRCEYIHLSLEEQPLTQQQWNDHLRTPITCPQCGELELPEPCEECTECHSENHLTIWDVKISLIYTRAPKRGKKDSWTLKYRSIDPLTPKQREAIKDICIPYDFAEIMGPSTIDEQRVLLHEGATPSGPQGYAAQGIPQTQSKHHVPYDDVLRNPQSPSQLQSKMFTPPQFNSGQR